MSNMLPTIIPKSDQLNADDLIGGRTLTIKITKVSILAGEQPVALSYEGDSGKPYKPGKSMRRVLVSVWGSDANKYIGRSLTVYRDEKVKFGGDAVGGIRISHMSDIAEPVTIALTATRTSRKPFTIRPLADKDLTVEDYISEIKGASTLENLQHKFTQAQKSFKGELRFGEIINAKDKRKSELTASHQEN